MNFRTLLDLDSPIGETPQKNKFNARIFGIFNEEIIRIWCKTQMSKYVNLGRPTLYIENEKRGKTLDFTLLDKTTDKPYIAEMKSWIEYGHYKFLTFNEATDLSSFIKQSSTFKSFMNFNQDKLNNAVSVKIKQGNTRIKIDCFGSILIWPRIEEINKTPLCKKHGLHDIISLENVINDLIEQRNEEYFQLIEKRKTWFNSFLSGLTN